MNNEETNLDSLFDDVFKEEGAEQPEAAPAGDDDRKEGSDTPKENKEQKPAQDAEENRRQAENRRRREQQQAQMIERAVAAERAEMDSVVASLGIENPETGESFKTAADLKTYAKSLRKARGEAGKLTEADIREIARETMQPKQEDVDNAEVARQLEMIRELDPAMADLGAILQSDIGESFRKYVNEGATFVQAYGRATREKAAITDGTKAAEAAKAAGKGHLGATSSRGQGALEVPADEMALFKELCPEMSSAEIQKFYNEDRKKFGR